MQIVSQRLQEQGFVEDAGVFRWYTEHHGGLELTPGYYELRTSDHMGNLLARLRTPPSETYTKVTFPEGFTVGQVAARLERDMSTMTAADVAAAAADPALLVTLRPPGVTSLEGMLFPDTYQVSNGDTPARVLGRMIGQMERVAGQEDMVAKGAELGRTPYEILIIASMIEREAKTDADRPKIARVIYNRLARDIAAARSTPPSSTAPSSPVATRQRSRSTSSALTPGPYNTYQNPGLPPTPIANPGRASIRAALNPSANPSVGDPLCDVVPEGQPCEYLFYVLKDEEGNHAFAVTVDQHEANVARRPRRRHPLGRDRAGRRADRPPGRPLAVAGAAPGGVRRRRARLGLRGVRRGARLRTRARSTPSACSASPGSR